MIEDENGDIYISSYTGLWRLPKQSQSWEKYDRNTEEVNRAYATAFHGAVLPLALLPNPGTNYLYLGFDSEQLVRFDKKGKYSNRSVIRQTLKEIALAAFIPLSATGKARCGWVAAMGLPATIR